MNEKLNGIFSYLDIDDKTGLASENNVESLSAFQKLFYEQARSKIGVDAVYFLRDEEGVAKIPLVPSRFMRKFICRLRLNEVSRQ